MTSEEGHHEGGGRHGRRRASAAWAWGGGPPIGLNMAAGGAPEGMEDGGGAAVAPPGGGRANSPAAERRSAERRSEEGRSAEAARRTWRAPLLSSRRISASAQPRPRACGASSGPPAVAGPGTRSDELTGARADYKMCGGGPRGEVAEESRVGIETEIGTITGEFKIIINVNSLGMERLFFHDPFNCTTFFAYFSSLFSLSLR